MAHEVESMMYVGDTPWHGLGDAIPETINLAQQEFAATVAQYRQLASKQINSTDLVKYVRLVFDLKERKGTPAQKNRKKSSPV